MDIQAHLGRSSLTLASDSLAPPMNYALPVRMTAPGWYSDGTNERMQRQVRRVCNSRYCGANG